MRCRRIEPGDLEALAGLLTRCFPARRERRWRAALDRLLSWVRSGGLPGMGFVLVQDGRLVGCLLTLYAPDGLRCNLSSWCAEPPFRQFATLLVNAAMKDRAVTYVNVSSERHTRPIIEAQGFRRYNSGVVLAVPLLGWASARRARVSWNLNEPAAHAEAGDAALLRHHAGFGCIAFWCVADGRAFPFVIRRRLVAGWVPVGQLVYCPPDTDWSLVGPAVGRALLRYGIVSLMFDAIGPLPGVPGRFLPGRMLKYARGPRAQRCCDLAYTEIAVIGT